MATLATTFQTYQQIGRREDLSDIIANISPTETPFFSSLKKKKCSSIKFEWQTDSLATAANNAQIEGDDLATYTAVTPTVRWDNYCQIARKDFLISRTADVVNTAGREKDTAMQKVKKGLEIRRDVEVSLLQNTTYNAGAAATARQTRGCEGWLFTNSSVGAGAGVLPVPSTNTAPVAGTARTFTETLLKAASSSCFTNGGNPTMLHVGAAHKLLVSAFAGTNVRNINTEDGKLNTAINVYISDFHELKVVPNRFIRGGANGVALLIDPEYAAFRQLDGLTFNQMAKTGDAEKYMGTWEYGLEITNEAAHAQIRDLSP